MISGVKEMAPTHLETFWFEQTRPAIAVLRRLRTHYCKDPPK